MHRVKEDVELAFAQNRTRVIFDFGVGLGRLLPTLPGSVNRRSCFERLLMLKPSRQATKGIAQFDVRLKSPFGAGTFSGKALLTSDRHVVIQVIEVLAQDNCRGGNEAASRLN